MPSPQNRQNLFVAVVLIALVSALVWLAVSRIKWIEQEHNLGYSKEALRNPYLAAQNFLRHLSIDSEHTIKFTLLDSVMSNTADTPAPRDTIILANAAGAISDRRAELLMAWVKQGGTLVTSIQNPFIGSDAKHDAIFDELGVSVIEERDFYHPEDEFPDGDGDGEETDHEIVEGDGDNDHQRPAEDEKEDTVVAGEGGLEPAGFKPSVFEYSDLNRCVDIGHVQIDLPGEASSLSVHFNASGAFSYDNYYPEWVLLNDDERAIAAKFSVGDGSITVLRSTSMWKNRDVQCHDHAYLLWSFAEGSEKVWFLENHNAPSLFALVVAYLPYVCLAFPVFILLGLWSALTRFGPVFRPQRVSRRSFSEHIEASANFLWKHGRYNDLLGAIRRAVDSSMQRRDAGYEKKNRQDKLAAIMKFVDIEASVLDKAMFQNEIDTRSEFTDIVKTLKYVKDKL